MPELPEVETIVRFLRTEGGITGKTITGAQVLWPRSLTIPSIGHFIEDLRDQKILLIERRGKFLQFCLTRQFLLIHLRMSGDIIVESAKTMRDIKHDRVILEFFDGSRMVFNDPRKFGRVWLVEDPLMVTGSLGPEPLDESLTADLFHTMLGRVKRQIKPLLMDQTFIAGMGNIYTDEALFIAHIHPCAPSNRINLAKASDLLDAIRHALQEGIKGNGASIDWVYRGGDFQNHFKVYQRDGQSCYRCGAIIERIVIAQRGTHFCPHCQQMIS